MTDPCEWVDPTAPQQRLGLWKALRCNPNRLPELAVLHAVPLVAGSVERWCDGQPRTADEAGRAEAAARTVKRSIGTARRLGIIVGSSFYLGMGPAMMATYLEQVLAILRVAALYGHAPLDPSRPTEILVLQGRYPSLDQAEAALLAATSMRTKALHDSPRRAVAELVRQVPSMIGFRVVKRAKPVEVFWGILQVISLLIPVLSIPLWVLINGRSVRRFGRSAIAFYGEGPPDHRALTVTLPEPPPRRRVATTILLGTVGLGAMGAIVPLGHFAHILPLGGVVIAEVGLILVMLRLLLVTRPGPPPTPST